MAYARRGLAFEAQRCLERHLEGGGGGGSELWGHVAMAWARRGDLPRARSVLEQMLAHDLLPSSSVVAQILGLAAKCGDQSLVAWLKALKRQEVHHGVLASKSSSEAEAGLRMS